MAPQSTSSPSSLNYASIQNPKAKNLPPPPGFAKVDKRGASTSAKDASASHEALKQRRAWDLSYSPAKQLPMQAIMLYMSGSSIQIFSIGILVMLLFTPFTSMSKLSSTFAPYAPPKNDPNANMIFLLQKITYIGCNLLTLALGLWKCRQVGLLPQGTGDWLAFETRAAPPEIFLS